MRRESKSMLVSKYHSLPNPLHFTRADSTTFLTPLAPHVSSYVRPVPPTILSSVDCTYNGGDNTTYDAVYPDPNRVQTAIKAPRTVVLMRPPRSSRHRTRTTR